MAHDIKAALFGCDRLLAVARQAYGDTSPVTAAVAILGRQVALKCEHAHSLNQKGLWSFAEEVVTSAHHSFRAACSVVKRTPHTVGLDSILWPNN